MSQAKHWDERIMQRLKLRELRILKVVAELGSMGRAAVQLAISQPSVSKAIAEMEYTLGVRLLDRTAQGVEPTPYGRALLKWAAAIFDDLRQGVREIELLADPMAGEVRVAAPEAMSAGLLPAIIDRLSRRYPRIVVRMVQVDMSLDFRELRGRNADLMLARLPAPSREDDLDVEILFDEALVLAAGANSKWVRRRKLDVADLISEPWCLPPYDMFVGSLIAEAFRERGLAMPRLAVASTSVHLQHALLATGRFVSVASASTLRFNGKRLALRALPVDFPIRALPVCVVTLKNRMISPVAERFIECAREVAKPLGRKRQQEATT
jgi:DNA-binding transcriptional LysR family regulator